MQNNFLEENGTSDVSGNMQEYLERMQDRGVELIVDGKRMMPGEVVRTTVREDCMYMADYVFGENGNIQQIRFDKLSRL